MKSDYLIIGGGVAGLSAANHLAEAGREVTLLEGGRFPSHKICGEFLSPEALPILHRWDIEPSALINEMTLILPKKSWSTSLPDQAGTAVRFDLDHALSQRAKQFGANIVTDSQVEQIIPSQQAGDPIHITLSTGQEWVTANLIISTGRLVHSLLKKKPPTFSAIGAKAHFSGIELPNRLQMHLIPGSYFGLAPIGEKKVNVAGLILCSPDEAKHPRETLSQFLQHPKSEALSEILMNGKCEFEDWMVGPVPPFGIKETPDWPNTYFVGDAAGTIPPATGNGLAMGLTSGILAGEFAMKNDPSGYKQAWKETYQTRIRYGKILHQIFLNPWLSNAIPKVAKAFPFLPKQLFRLTRENP